MINKIDSLLTRPAVLSQVTPHRPQYVSTLSSIQKECKIQAPSFIKKSFFIFAWIYEWLCSKIGLTNKELDMLETLIESSMQAGSTYIYDRKEGEKALRKVLSSCDGFRVRLRKKWFPNLDGIVYLRQNLIKIQLRIYTALGEKKQIEHSMKELDALGCKLSESFKKQLSYLRLLQSPAGKALIWSTNTFLQAAFWFCD